MRYTWFTTYVWIWLHVHVNLMWLISSVAPLNKHSTILPPHSEHMLLNWDHHLGRETKQYSNHQAHHWLYSHHVPVSDQNILNPFKSYVCWLNCDAIQSTPNNVQDMFKHLAVRILSEIQSRKGTHPPQRKCIEVIASRVGYGSKLGY